MATKVGNIFVELGLNSRGLTAGLSAAARQLRDFASINIPGGGMFGSLVAFEGLKAGLGGAAGLLGQVKGFMDQSAFAASDLNEQISATRVQLGTAADEAFAFARGMAEAGQQSMGEALQGITSVTTALMGQGVAQDEAIQRAKELQQRFADLSSQRNVGVGEVQEAFQSMMRGEFDPVERLNVFGNMEKLKATGKPIGLAAAEEFLRQTQSAQGDFANTSLSLANLTRQNETVRGGIMGQVGDALAPAYQAAAWFENQFLKKFADEINGRLGPAGDAIFSGINGIGETILEYTPWIADKFIMFGNYIGEAMRLVGSMIRSPGEYLGLVLREIGVSLIDIVQKVFPNAMKETEATLRDGIDRNRATIAERDAAAAGGEDQLKAMLEAGSQGKAPDLPGSGLDTTMGATASRAKGRSSSFADYFKGVYASGSAENPQKQQVELAKAMDQKLGVIAAAVSNEAPGTRPIGSAVPGVI
jgi:hypothetical protein